MDTILSQRRRSLVLSLGALAVAGCGRPGKGADAGSGYLSFGGMTMGSTYTVRLQGSHGDAAELRRAVQSALDAVDARMSLYRVDSQLSRFNRAAAGQVELPEDLALVLVAAKDVSRWSDGAFDVTVAPLVKAWGFGPGGTRSMPAAEELAAYRRDVGWRGLVVDPAGRRATKAHAGLQADLGGIAKGYGVDRAAAVLEAGGVRNYMVEAGGEVRTGGVNAEGGAWRIGIEEPDSSVRRARWAVPLMGRAMATSGDYREFYEQAGARYSHEIDVVNGAPIRHNLCSVTVVAEDCMHADALATALIVLGPERGPTLAEASGVAAQFIVRDGTRLVDSHTSAFAALGAVRA